VEKGLGNRRVMGAVKVKVKFAGAFFSAMRTTMRGRWRTERDVDLKQQGGVKTRGRYS